MVDIDSIETWAETAYYIATAAGVLAAGWWFFFSGSFRKKVAFDVECTTVPGARGEDEELVELAFLLSNRGQVENRCYTLAYEVQSVDATRKGAPAFVKRSGNIVPAQAGYYYVQAGVTVRITSRLWIPPHTKALRVKAFMLFDRRRHEIREDTELFEQMYRYKDWGEVDRILRLEP
jgi:hypothetical protein